VAHRRSLLAAATVLAVLGGTAAVQLLPGAAPVARAEGLIPYDGCEELLGHYRRELRATATPWGLGGGFGVGRGMALDTAASAGGTVLRAAAPLAAGAEGAAGAGQPAVGAGQTGTNLQEQGVDEPDRVKLRDGRLVVLARGRIQVLTAQAEPEVVGSLRLGGEDQSWGSELLLVGDRALVVAPGWRADAQPEPATATARTSIVRPGIPTTRLVLVDLAQDQPRLLEEATYDAQYVSARLTGGTVRLVTTNRPQPPQTQPREPGLAAEQEALAANQASADTLELDDLLPRVVRTDAAGTVLQAGSAVPCASTAHAEQPRGVSTLLVATLQPGHGLHATDSTAVTTDGDLVYASAERLYVATGRWGTTGPVRPIDDTAKGVSAPAPSDEVTTELHAFDTASATRTRYVGTGSVPGYVLGRWALSEHEGTLRVATTRQPPWAGERRGASSSMVVKLDERDGALVETGRVEGLGRTEQIKAVRYFGDLAAVVTFRQTDPLYLIDLAGAPKVLGELKVPGFSTYLHPLGGGMLLGLGLEADSSGRVTGMQASVFDISDPSTPTQVSRVALGAGWSPALDDSRAFTYDPARRLAVFAFSTYGAAGDTSTGALGLSVSEDGTVTEVGRLEVHPSTPPDRVLVDADRIYAVSDHGVATGDPATMTRTGAVDLAGQ
jgi:hypothetical protein